MNYELAKKLKDAGFQQESHLTCQHGAVWPNHYPDCENTTYAQPGLEELIEACGERFKGIVWRHQKKFIIPGQMWSAQGRLEKGQWVKVWGEGPVEAVANLWLALNTKKE